MSQPKPLSPSEVRVARHAANQIIACVSSHCAKTFPDLLPVMRHIRDFEFPESQTPEPSPVGATPDMSTLNKGDRETLISVGGPSPQCRGEIADAILAAGFTRAPALPQAEKTKALREGCDAMLARIRSVADPNEYIRVSFLEEELAKQRDALWPAAPVSPEPLVPERPRLLECGSCGTTYSERSRSVGDICWSAGSGPDSPGQFSPCMGKLSASDAVLSPPTTENRDDR